MGDWTIVIEGTGQHDNGMPEDADAILREFYKELVRVGCHSNLRVSFTVGGRRLTP